MPDKHENIDEEISIEPFNEEWRRLYQIEAFRIREVLGSEVTKIQPIGSTVIPGVYAKPIVDIMIGLQNIEQLEQVINKLIKLGYEYCGEAGVPGRLYFKVRGEYNYNLALCKYQGEIWKNNILFRDYLLNHPNEAKSYSNLKKKIIASGVHNLLRYSMLKQRFIEKILKKAKKC